MGICPESPISANTDCADLRDLQTDRIHSSLFFGVNGGGNYNVWYRVTHSTERKGLAKVVYAKVIDVAHAYIIVIPLNLTHHTPHNYVPTLKRLAIPSARLTLLENTDDPKEYLHLFTRLTASLSSLNFIMTMTGLVSVDILERVSLKH
jgi:hypothetical protein